MTDFTRDAIAAMARAESPWSINLVRADLSGLDLSGLPLPHAFLAQADLRGANLSNCDLTSAVFRDADLTGADLTGANLSGAELTGATLDPCQLLDCRGLRPEVVATEVPLPAYGLPQEVLDVLLPTDPEHRRLAEHLLNDAWDGTIREAIETAGELIGL